MALTIDATPGSADANSYVTLSDADTILEGEYNTAEWDGATDANKNKALVQSTRQIDTLNLDGIKWNQFEEGNSSFQALHFPVQRDANGASYTTQQIPAVIEKATAIQAAYIIRIGTSRQKSDDLLETGIESHKIGTFSETFKGGESSSKPMVCHDARATMRRWIRKYVDLVRG